MSLSSATATSPLQRLIANAFDEKGNVRQSPWILNHPNTLVGTMKVFVRWTYQVEKNGYRESKVRCLEGMEYMRLFGWADSDWKPFRWKQVWEDVFHHTQGLANMVGNACSGFQYAAHYMALMATWGRFGQHAGNQSLPHASTSVEARPQQSGSESDETGSSYTSGSSRGCMAELLADRQRADAKAEASFWSEGCGGT